MLKEFGLRPDEVDRIDSVLLEELKILHETLKKEEEWQSKGR